MDFLAGLRRPIATGPLAPPQHRDAVVGAMLCRCRILPRGNRHVRVVIGPWDIKKLGRGTKKQKPLVSGVCRNIPERMEQRSQMGQVKITGGSWCESARVDYWYSVRPRILSISQFLSLSPLSTLNRTTVAG